MQDKNNNIIEIRGLSFSRGDRVIFDAIDMDIPRGQITAIMGPSGTGKTTLMSLITGQIKPDVIGERRDCHSAEILPAANIAEVRIQ